MEAIINRDKRTNSGVLLNLAPRSASLQRLADGTDATPVVDLLESFGHSSWPTLNEADSQSLVVCSLHRNVEDLTALLWLLDEGLPVVLVDAANTGQAAIAARNLGATHIYSRGEIAPSGVSTDTAVHRDRRVILPTSGSSGRPKYVSMGAGAIVGNALSVAKKLGLNSQDVGMTTLTPAYSYGLSNLLAHLLVGARLVVSSSSVTAGEFWDSVENGGVTSLAFAAGSAPMVLAAMKRGRDLSGVRRIMFAGGAVPKELVSPLYELCGARGIDLRLMYGQTETGPRISISPPGLAREKWGSCGRPIPGVSLEIVDDLGRPVPNGVVGRIVAKTDYNMSGYVASACDLFEPRECKASRPTGDRGSIDDDGLLWLVGRTDDVVKISGYRVDLGDVRDIARQLLGPEVAAHATRDRLYVCVKVSNQSSSLTSINSVIADRIGIPREHVSLVMVDDIPRSVAGKVDTLRLESLIHRSRTGAHKEA
ncbi:AMP-binding protein [Promicromonospora kroppenstedtii]|uniref:class I adenylate-forming enzyme family protein n=1 Tax=Promicromonospora kroppenstedtii TaxID=440482 RepID=UPI000A031F88